MRKSNIEFDGFIVLSDEKLKLLNAVGIHRPVGRSAYVVLAEISQPWRDQLQEALRGSACPVVEGAGPCAHAHDWQSWVRGDWYGRPGPR